MNASAADAGNKVKFDDGRSVFQAGPTLFHGKVIVKTFNKILFISQIIILHSVTFDITVANLQRLNTL